MKETSSQFCFDKVQPARNKSCILYSPCLLMPEGLPFLLERVQTHWFCSTSFVRFWKFLLQQSWFQAASSTHQENMFSRLCGSVCISTCHPRESGPHLVSPGCTCRPLQGCPIARSPRKQGNGLLTAPPHESFHLFPPPPGQELQFELSVSLLFPFQLP